MYVHVCVGGMGGVTYTNRCKSDDDRGGGGDLTDTLTSLPEECAVRCLAARWPPLP